MVKTKYDKKPKIMKNTKKGNTNKTSKTFRTFTNKKVIKKVMKTSLLKGGAKNPFAALLNNTTTNNNNSSSKNTNKTNKTNSTKTKPTTLSSTNSNLTGFIHNLSLKLKEARNSFLQFETQIDRETLYLKLMPDLLSVDKLQYYINTNKISINNQGVNNYLQLDKNTFSLDILKSFYSRTGNQEGSDLIDVYESVDIDKEIYSGDRLTQLYKENLDNLLKQELFLLFVKQKNSNPELEYYSIIQEDIKWLKEITGDLNAITSDSPASPASQTKNIDLFLNNKTDDIKKVKFNSIDLNVHNLDHLLFEDKYSNGDKLIIGGEEYVIIGYPDQVMKSYLDFLKDEIVKGEFDNIYKDHKDNFIKYMAELHNFIYSSSPIEKQISMETMELVKDEIHKFYGYEDYYKYITDFYENAFTEENKENEDYGIPYDPAFQTKLKELQKAFYNELASKYLNKPMMQIQYVFLIFKKHTDGNYVPALFNFRELKHKHHTLLQRIEELIKTKLPKIYGIIDDSNTDGYKLWYSHYNYGDVFHIKSKYVHTMSNIQQQAYKYKNSITLEELIYMLSIPDVELINLKLDYQKKNVRFSFINGNINPQHFRDDDKLSDYYKKIDNFFKTTYKITKDPIQKLTIKPTQKLTKKQIKCYKHETQNDTIASLQLDSLSNSKVLFMFVETGYIYTFVYKNKENNFYILKIEPNLCALIEKFKKYLEINSTIITDEYMKDKNKDKIKFTMTLDIPNINLYKIVKHTLLKPEDYKVIMRYNPLLIRTIKKINTEEKTILISEFFDSPLVEINKFTNHTMLIPNSYTQKPFFIRNILASITYKREFENFKNKIRNNIFTYTYRDKEVTINDDIIDILDDKYLYSLYDDNDININRIYFNPNNCGYTLIDKYEKLSSGEFKSVIWIVPLNATSNNKLNEEYDDIFSKIKYIGNYIGNFIYLNDNHIEMINQVKRIYSSKDTFCNVNIQSKSLSNFCLHFHILKKVNYKSKFSYFEQGSRMYAMLDLNIILNNIYLFNKYYNNLNINIILHNDN
jgi:hypothetical protein